MALMRVGNTQKRVSNYCKCGHTFGEHGYGRGKCNGAYIGGTGEWKMADDGMEYSTITRKPCESQCGNFMPRPKATPRQLLSDVSKQCRVSIKKINAGKVHKVRCKLHPVIGTAKCWIHTQMELPS